MLDRLKKRLFAQRWPSQQATSAARCQTGYPFSGFDQSEPLMGAGERLYSELRQAVPVIDAAIMKLVRLIGQFQIQTGEEDVDRELSRFLQQVQVGGAQQGVYSFVTGYLDSLLTFGDAVGEIVLTPDGKEIAGLYNAPLDGVEIVREKDGYGAQIGVRRGGKLCKLQAPELVFHSAFLPAPGEVKGRSLLQGLSFISGVLLRIFYATGQNFERIGNVRFAVTYKPGGEGIDRTLAKERAGMIAREWSKAMSPGAPRDFVCVGDVDIKVIGADNQIPDIQVPVRLMLEQIVAKTGLPPFLLGLSWSTTERMSSQQADILTSEIEAYRRILNPVLLKIAKVWLRLAGYPQEPSIRWSIVNLQDEVEMSKARLQRAQAAQIEEALTHPDEDYLKGDYE